MTLSCIWAQARGGAIGRDGTLPWHLPEDLALFKRLTTGSTVVMGRRTWESLPAQVRPLPGRRNIVLSRQPAYDAPGAEVLPSLAAALAAAPGGDVWVIGGASVYAEALAQATRVVRTEVDTEVDGADAWAPGLDGAWRLDGADPPEGWHTSGTGLRYRVQTFTRGSVSA